MRLAHLALPTLSCYSHASRIQQHLVDNLLSYKASASASASSSSSRSSSAATTTTTTTKSTSRSPSPSPPPPLSLSTAAAAISSTPPDPIILTAQFHPTYTTGRRDLHSLSADQIAHLRCNGLATFHAALRGGQTTYHGPGQLTAYPILDLRRHGLRARDYIRLLEESVIRTCARFGVGGASRTENPGVWVTENKKICAVGVHLRRNVTSHGIGLNVTTETAPWFERIVACGLEGKGATSLEAEGVPEGGLTTVEEVGDVFVQEFVKGLEGQVEEVYRISEKDLLLNMEGRGI